MKILLLLAALLSTNAYAVPVTIEWQLAATDCGGQPAAPSEIVQMEIYISAGPIPAADVSCPPAGVPVDTPPVEFSIRVDATAVDGSIVVDLIGGVTYHVRARVRSASGWSNLSGELQREVPSSPLRAPVIISINL